MKSIAPIRCGLSGSSTVRGERAGRFAVGLALCALTGCTPGPDPETAAVTGALESAGCGYAVSADVTKVNKKGFRATIKITSTTGRKLASTGFTVLVNAGAATLVKVGHGTFQRVENGYLLSTVNRSETEDDCDGDAVDDDADVLGGKAYRFHLRFDGPYTQLAANIISSSGTACDQTAPAVKLAVSGDFFTANGTLTLTAQATDNVAVAKVVFARDGVAIGAATAAPYTLAVPVTSALNGRHRYSATAYDLTGNQASEAKRVLVAIGNKFFGTAANDAGDYAGLLAHFNQITPGNAGKWGSVEAVRDQMSWTELDTAYAFAKSNHIPFKLHTLVWGQQQPAWLAQLSSAEQLEELEEWMTALAARYPSVDLIDVVNEPLHAPPGYAAALGGAGATGWDWVVSAFEMARAHFPNAELLLNDYSVLTMAGTTQDYLKIVKVLSDRGLIDGIGEQGHFYERAPELSVLSANLGALAATGLPLYISELDLSFADDAQQANRMRDLFSMFWSHPSVVGITHWGFRQGNMWQPDAYLVRTDGSLRPALTFIECYRAGGTSCPVPPYVPQPRTGDASGITLQAEEYDAAHALLPAGNVVAYASDGSWFELDKVVFDGKWDTLSVAYANGGGNAITLTVHLDGLASAPVATVTLAPSGDWGTMKTVSIPWTPLAGQRNVFVRFNGGGANVDKLSFTASVGPQTNIVANGTFESGTAGWFTWNGATLSTSTARKHGGGASLLVSNRAGNGPAATDLTSVAKAGKSYPMSLWASIQSPDGTSKAINVTQAMSCKAADGSVSTTYAWIAGPTTLAGDASWSWVQFSGTVTIPASCTLTQLQLFVEGGAGADLYVDDVQVLDSSTGPTNLITDGTFESGQGGWFGWGSTVSVAAGTAHGGSKSLLGAGMQFGALAHDIKSVVAPGKRYQATAWVSVANLAAGSGLVKFQTVQNCNGAGDSYPWLTGNTVANGAWMQLVGTVDLTGCSTIGNLLLFVGADAGDLYIDDVTLTALP
jgi:endo-1,4-beta-xylanase